MLFLINWVIASLVQSLVFTSIILFLIYWFYLKELPKNQAPFKTQYEQFSLDNTLKDMIDKNKTETSTGDTCLNGDSNCTIGLNMMFQFLFQELKDTKAIRRYITRKISAEFNELLTTKSAGKFITRISARDFSLGTSFPIIHSIKLQSYEMDSSKKLIEEMSILLDLEYKNGFSLSLDTDLILGKSAYFHIKIASIKGKARIQFGRQPFTHWSFAFVEEPLMDIDASSQFDGRQIPQLTSLIVNQIRRSICRRHTLPNYKIRFKPFFEPVYDQKLYKAHIEKMLKDDLMTNTNSKESTNKSNDSNSKSSDSKTEKINKSDLRLSFKGKHNLQYKKLCEKIGFDLTSVGHLIVQLKNCDRLPEALYSINLNQAQTTPVAPAKPTDNSTNQLSKSISAQQLSTISNSTTLESKDTCFIYLTASLDSVSMQTLMEKQICKENWPLIEFEIQKSTANQNIGINFIETLFINKTEVCVQKIFPNSIASSIQNLKVFDIVHSLNQVRITSIKQLNKLIQKFGTNPLKFVVQRPCILMNKSILTSGIVNKPTFNLDDEQQTLNLNTNSNSSPKTPSLIQTIIPPPPPPLPLSSTPIPQKLEIKSNTSNSNLTELPQQQALSNTTSVPIDNTNTTNTSTTPNIQPQISKVKPNNQTNTSVPTVTHTASSSCLVDYYCSLSECLIGDQLITLDLISLLTNSTQMNCSTNENSINETTNATNATINSNESSTSLDQKRQKLYFKKTRDIKLDKENLFSLTRQPVQIDETVKFDLNSNTHYLNLFLWTVQYLNKSTKKKNLLIGYVTLPLNEINVDCWNTTKGETQTTNYFRPVGELKASAISKLARSHVISDHIGFDTNISLGNITLNIQHKIETKSEENNGEQLTENKVDKKDLAAKVGDELIENKNIEIEFKKQSTKNPIDLLNKDENLNEDTSLHKFLNVQFNQMVICEICNKKIWFKNAYQCGYCGCIIHLKCYEKAIGKTICPRFFSNNNLPINNNNKPANGSSNQNDESFVILNTNEVENLVINQQQNENSNKVKKRSSSPSQYSQISSSSESSNSNRGVVASFISGIRQRRFNHNQNSAITDANLDSVSIGSSTTTSKTSSFLSNLTTKIRKVKELHNIESEIKNPVQIESIVEKNLDDSILDNSDEFKDVDPSEDKFFGDKLFEDLPLEERKVKLEETIEKYQSTIEMMSKLKFDLEEELINNLKSKSPNSNNNNNNNKKSNQKTVSQQEDQIKSQIRHLDEQIKCVLFLLMQYQIGLENCKESLGTSNPIKIFDSNMKESLASKKQEFDVGSVVQSLNNNLLLKHEEPIQEIPDILVSAEDPNNRSINSSN